jgi:hypothetical protein
VLVLGWKSLHPSFVVSAYLPNLKPSPKNGFAMIRDMVEYMARDKAGWARQRHSFYILVSNKIEGLTHK